VIGGVKLLSLLFFVNKKYLKSSRKTNWVLDEEKIKKDERFGKWCLVK
jgi:hypothetical protein